MIIYKSRTFQLIIIEINILLFYSCSVVFHNIHRIPGSMRFLHSIPYEDI